EISGSNNTAQVFSPIPLATATTTVKTTATPTAGDSTDVTFAAKVDTSVPSGTYLDTVVFSAVTNYLPPVQANVTIAPIETTGIDGGETFTLNTDVEWIDNIGQMVVTLYPANDITNTATCTNPTAVQYTYDGTNGPASGSSTMVVGQDYLSITCTSPARDAGTYNVKLELLRFNTEYTAANTITYTDPFYDVTITKGTGINQISGTNITATTAATATGQNRYTTTVTLEATLATGYNTPTWTVTSGGVTLSAATGTSVSFTMPAEPVTVSVSARVNTYTIAYAGNGATSGSTAATTATYNAAHGLRGNGFARTGHTFLGWSTSASAGSASYGNGATLTAAQVNSLVSGLANGATRTLYAIWRANTYTVTFHVNVDPANPLAIASVSPSSVSRTYGQAIGSLPTPTTAGQMVGFTFMGWYTSAGCRGSKVSASTTVTGNVTYYARWYRGGICIT
ncbi:InlB B-repeat-containing protein, partial [Candidatus Saccharibacteria bacterium]|nr:InlB B-repeat-containing protein [Candidatus Saccharibacteria bacterium]